MCSFFSEHLDEHIGREGWCVFLHLSWNKCEVMARNNQQREFILSNGDAITVIWFQFNVSVSLDELL